MKSLAAASVKGIEQDVCTCACIKLGGTAKQPSSLYMGRRFYFCIKVKLKICARVIIKKLHITRQC